MEKEKEIKVEEKVETKVEEKTVPKVKESKKKKNVGVILLIVGLFLVIMGLISYILYPYINTFVLEFLPNSETEEVDEEEDLDSCSTLWWFDDSSVKCEEDEFCGTYMYEGLYTFETEAECNNELPEAEEENTDEVITGDIVSVTVPEGWTLVEYTNGDGTTMLSGGGTYTGLTGLKIFNPQNENVFSMMAVSGIGFAGCSDYAKFSDESESYYQEQVSNNTDSGITMEEHDYTSTVYSEFDWLGTTIRRITDLYYYDTKEGNNYFEPPCVPGLIVLEGLTFEDSFGYVGEAYFYGLEDIAETSEYEIVDDILESMETV